MKILAITLSAILLSQLSLTDAFGELSVTTNSLVFAPGEPMFVYGNGIPNESLIIRLFAPDNTIAVFEQIMTKDDGSFHYMAWQWDEPTENLPF